MEHQNNTPGEKRGAFTRESEVAAEYLSRLQARLTNDEISPDVMPEWLDNVFRYEAVPDNNTVWGRAIRDITQYVNTEGMARSFEQTQWRTMVWGEKRIIIQMSTVVDDAVARVEAERQRLERYFDSGLMEPSDIRGQLQNAFIASVSAVTYKYYAHADDLGFALSESQLLQGMKLADGSVYVPGVGSTDGMRALSPDVSISQYGEAAADYPSFIATCQANTCFNELLWNDLEQVAPIPAPVPNNFA